MDLDEHASKIAHEATKHNIDALRYILEILQDAFEQDDYMLLILAYEFLHTAVEQSAQGFMAYGIAIGGAKSGKTNAIDAAEIVLEEYLLHKQATVKRLGEAMEAKGHVDPTDLQARLEALQNIMKNTPN